MKYRRARIVTLVLLATLIQGCGRPAYHIVRPGESLYLISWRYDQDYHDLATWNGLAPPYTVRPGQSIALARPPGSGAPQVNPGVSTPATRSPPSVAEKSAPLAKAKAKRQQPQDAQTAQTVPLSNAKPRWRWPVRGELIHGFDGKAKGIQGRGLDIAGRDGAAIRSAAAGQVVYSGSGIPSYGNLLIIKHNERYLSAYAYNRRLLVREGEAVRDGQVIAEMGSSSTASTQAMLHFEIRLNGKPVDPARLLP